MGERTLGNGNDNFKAHKEGGFLGIGKKWRSWTINGQGGQDTIIGGAKNDSIYGGDGNDSVRGEGDKIVLHKQPSYYGLELLEVGLGSNSNLQDTVILYDYGGNYEIIGIALDINLTAFGLDSSNFQYLNPDFL